MDPVKTALQQIGLEKATWKTVVVSASQEVDLPRAILWETWARLEAWPNWSKPLHLAARWSGPAGWVAGATFEQELNLGFPVGKMTSAETVGAVVPEEQVMWSKDEKGIKSCHIWRFETVSANRTRVSNVEVFHGTLMGLVKPLVANRWQQYFEQAVKGLAALAASEPRTESPIR
ncbi:MAG TPA: SRPBCC family protein [Aggregatilineaceae bacterium]|nr:SRPBCC family protein [Aggregatilineaceae bacterium]